MKVFISWSGAVSHKIAAALNDWLPYVLKDVKPFLSSEDIRKGGQWFSEIGNQLENTDFGILCLTPGNRNNPWILFEAGALSKKITKAHVVPLLACLQPSDLTPPLSNFNATVLTKDDIFKLVKTINTMQPDNRYTEGQLDKVFSMCWGELDSSLREAEADITKGEEGKASAPARTQDEMLKEILDLVRGMTQRQGPDPDWIKWMLSDIPPLPAGASIENVLRHHRARETLDKYKDLALFAGTPLPLASEAGLQRRHPAADGIPNVAAPPKGPTEA